MVPQDKYYASTTDYATAISDVKDILGKEDSVFIVSGMSGHSKHLSANVTQDYCSADVQTQAIKDCIGL